MNLNLLEARGIRAVRRLLGELTFVGQQDVAQLLEFVVIEVEVALHHLVDDAFGHG